MALPEPRLRVQSAFRRAHTSDAGAGQSGPPGAGQVLPESAGHVLAEHEQVDLRGADRGEHGWGSVRCGLWPDLPGDPTGKATENAVERPRDDDPPTEVADQAGGTEQVRPTEQDRPHQEADAHTTDWSNSRKLLAAVIAGPFALERAIHGKD